MQLHKYLTYVTKNFACDELTKWLNEQNYRLPLISQPTHRQRMMEYLSYWKKREEPDEYEVMVREPFNKLLTLTTNLMN